MGEVIVKDLTSGYTLIYLELKYITNIAMATLQVRKNPCQPWSAKSEHAVIRLRCLATTFSNTGYLYICLFLEAIG